MREVLEKIATLPYEACRWGGIIDKLQLIYCFGKTVGGLVREALKVGVVLLRKNTLLCETCHWGG